MDEVSTTPAESSFLKTLGSISTITAASSFGIICVAFIHEWAYFGIVGRQFQSVISPSDYITNAIGWLPLFAAAIAFAHTNDLFTRRLEGFRSQTEMRALYKTPKRAWWALDAPWVIGGWLFALSAVFALIAFNIYEGGSVIALGASIIWFWTAQWYMAHKQVAQTLTPVKMALLMFALPVALWSYILGLESGHRNLTQTERAYVLKLKNDDEEKNVLVLRTFTLGVLARDVTRNRVTLFKWDEVSSLSLRAQPADTRSYLCSIFDVMCRDDQRGPNP